MGVFSVSCRICGTITDVASKYFDKHTRCRRCNCRVFFPERCLPRREWIDKELDRIEAEVSEETKAKLGGLEGLARHWAWTRWLRRIFGNPSERYAGAGPFVTPTRDGEGYAGQSNFDVYGLTNSVDYGSTPVDPIDEILNREPTAEELEEFGPEALAAHREYARSLFG